MSGYLDYAGREDALSGGVRMIPIETPRGGYRVWTKRIGNNPKPADAPPARWTRGHP